MKYPSKYGRGGYGHLEEVWVSGRRIEGKHVLDTLDPVVIDPGSTLWTKIYVNGCSVRACVAGWAETLKTSFCVMSKLLKLDPSKMAEMSSSRKRYAMLTDLECARVLCRQDFPCYHN